MGTSEVARSALAVLVAALLAGFGLPWAAEQVVAARLEGELAVRFGAEVRVRVDVASPGALLRGRVARLEVLVPEHEVVVDRSGVVVRDTALVLREVRVDLGEALRGRLERVEVGPSSTLVATLDGAEVVGLVRARIAAERPDLAGLAVDVAGTDLRVTVSTSDGGTTSVEVRPDVVPGRVVLVPVGAEPADPAQQALADAVDGLEVALPALPLGLAFDGLVLDGDLARLTGRVPPVLELG